MCEPPPDLVSSPARQFPAPPHSPDLPTSVPQFIPNSCIILVGTTGRGKTTAMNLYTGHSAATGAASHGTTQAATTFRRKKNSFT